MAVNVQRAGSGRSSGAKLVKSNKPSSPSTFEDMQPKVRQCFTPALENEAQRLSTAWAALTGKPVRDLHKLVRTVGKAAALDAEDVVRLYRRIVELACAQTA